MKINYFATKKPLGSDIDRHMEKEKDLRKKISDLESNQNRDDFEDSVLRTYKRILGLLLASKAEVVSQIGKTK